MKLSRLITYKHMVDGLHISHIQDQIETELKQIHTDLSIQNIDFDNLKSEIEKQSTNIRQSMTAIESLLAQFKKNLHGFVNSIEEPYYVRSESLYQESRKDSAEYTLDQLQFKKLLYEPATNEFFQSRLKLHSNFKWPALEIRPGFGDLTPCLVACDPLYLVDTNDALLEPVKKMFTPEYQRRIRYYTIDESAKHIFSQLPRQQFGIIVAVNFLNFRPLPLIKKYVQESFLLLKPGGALIFTYNNCDYPIGVDNFENSYYCYTPGHQIAEICKQAGFRIAASFDLENNVSWLELQRPGRLSSIRGGQALGKIQSL
jgi:SAM-dependent methyltransferase